MRVGQVIAKLQALRDVEAPAARTSPDSEAAPGWASPWVPLTATNSPIGSAAEVKGG